MSINRENATCQLLNEQSNTYFNASNTCVPDFDKSLCWYNVSLGDEGHKPCPFTFCPSVPGCSNVAVEFNVNRQCYTNGTWGESVYSDCIDLLKTHSHCIVGFCRTCPDLLRETVINVSLTLSVVSVAVLVSALVLFSIFDSIQCRRLSIHKNLATAFVFRFAVLAIWTIASTSNVFRDCTHFNPIPLREWEWLCKGILWLVIYFQVASVMWMLIEGLYLYSRFTVLAMRHKEAPYFVYLLCGWGVPFIVVMSWTVVHQSRSSANHKSFCWLPYAQGAHLWILAGTMGSALILNVMLLLTIVIILVQKLRTENSAESKKIWRTVKATILLVPLLGVSNIPLFYEPNKPSAIYMLGSAILQHSQGIFIAVLYCFLNGEIQNAVRRQLSKMHVHWFSFLKLHRFESERTEKTYVPDSGQRKKNGHQRIGMQMEEINNCRQPPNTQNGRAHSSTTAATDVGDEFIPTVTSEPTSFSDLRTKPANLAEEESGIFRPLPKDDSSRLPLISVSREQSRTKF
ncbi:7 transmembrane receptor (Secretin family) domain-containing protein [Ditylenchus destructor]|uniref:7 transmembrane receptor (Secretin family) domain-containing protein n=1 Tax=Ditylenchus destructor TaxID=166010 RepID=A0AAD4NBW0_9BILA|nr:7 transmembrane receptor (Secretin family) domain-containing protein [Ditylenchus destructor]